MSIQLSGCFSARQLQQLKVTGARIQYTNHSKLYRCDVGYDKTSACSPSIEEGPQLPTSIVATISTDGDLNTELISTDGAVVGYQCGVLASGKAAVFNRHRIRKLETSDIRMSSTKYVCRFLVDQNPVSQGMHINNVI